jgi:hypothetical protein
MVWPLIKVDRLEEKAKDWSYLQLDRYLESVEFWAGRVIHGVQKFVDASEKIVEKLKRKIRKDEEAELTALRAENASLRSQQQVMH